MAPQAPTLPLGLEGVAELPAEAAAFAAVRLLDVSDAFSFVDLLAGLYPAVGAESARVRQALGLRAWSSSETSARGLDADTPLLVSWGRVEPGDWKDKGGPLMRHRLVARASDPVKLLPWVGDILERLGFEVVRVDAGRKSPPWWTDLKGLAKRAAVEVSGLGKDGTLVLARRAVNAAGITQVVVDVLEPLRPYASKGALVRAHARGAQAVLADAERSRSRTPPITLATTFAQGSRRALGADDGSIALVLQPAGLSQLIAESACRVALQSADGAWFQDAALVARLHPFEWRVRLLAAPTPAGKAGLGTAGSDDGLLDVRAMAGAGLGALAVYLPAVEALRSTPRPRFLGGTLADALTALAGCGRAGALVVAIRHAPHLLDLALDEAGAKIDAGPLARQARNIATAWRPQRPADAAATGWQLDSTFIASFAGKAEPDLAAALSRLATGKPETATFGDRSPRLWTLRETASYRQAGLESLPGARVGLALTSGDKGLDWYYSLRRRPAVFGSRGRLGQLHLNIGSFLEHEAEAADDKTLSAVRLAAGQIGMLGGDISIDADGLVRLELELGSAGN